MPTACNQLLTLHVDGNARILGTGNGDSAFRIAERPTDAEGRDFTIPAFNGYAQVLIQSTHDAGNATLSVSADGMKTAQLKLTVNK